MEEEIFKKLDCEEQGVNIDGKWLTDLRFADDHIKDIEVQLNSLNKESKRIGLKIHKGKPKFMANFQTNESIVVEMMR